MNKVIITGNLTAAPALKSTASGKSVCNFTVAVQKRFSNQQGVREADFIPVVVWGTLGENCAKYLDKGRKCAVYGALQVRKYTANDGSNRYATEVIADEVEFLDKGTQQSAMPVPPIAMHDAPTFDAGSQLIDDDDLPF